MLYSSKQKHINITQQPAECEHSCFRTWTHVHVQTGWMKPKYLKKTTNDQACKTGLIDGYWSLFSDTGSVCKLSPPLLKYHKEVKERGGEKTFWWCLRLKVSINILITPRQRFTYQCSSAKSKIFLQNHFFQKSCFE